MRSKLQNQDLEAYIEKEKMSYSELQDIKLIPVLSDQYVNRTWKQRYDDGDFKFKNIKDRWSDRVQNQQRDHRFLRYLISQKDKLQEKNDQIIMDMVIAKIEKIYRTHQLYIFGGCTILGILVFMRQRIPINIRLYCLIGMPVIGYLYYPRAAERAVKKQSSMIVKFAYQNRDTLLGRAITTHIYRSLQRFGQRYWDRQMHQQIRDELLKKK
ncbi:UNKNOWN [Stylonychia lemnae]|uniref:Transmembrane protein n=1 Tax=Stylonychia lemnae TaxID=5949 RepID=A0A078AW58_STYLE|nr:UNKNOWN [Stylonychia lemnae]|eukprot:CDW85028.1 UNKNOWN [Stylonychia lemnae]